MNARRTRGWAAEIAAATALAAAAAFGQAEITAFGGNGSTA